MLDEEMTIAEAKKLLREQWEKGLKCPCCNQLVKLYKPALRANMAMVLIDIYKTMQRTNKTWVHVMDEVKPINGDYAKLRFWGLLAPKGDDPVKDTKASGFWSVTDKGVDFILGKQSVPSRVHIFDNRKWGESGGMVSIQQALGKKFSWQELMGDYLSNEPEQGSLL